MTIDDADPVSRAVRRVRGLLVRRTAAEDEYAAALADDPRPEPASRDLDAVIGDCGVYERGRRLPGRVPLQEARAAARSADG